MSPTRTRAELWDTIADNLETVYSVKALKMALTSVCKPIVGLTHHSDRGVQYCASEYVKVLQDHDIEISMTAKGDPLENAIAERVNGILKHEYLYKQKVRNRTHAEQLLQKAVDLYNTERPHMSIGMFAPDIVHNLNLSVKRQWKNYYLNKTVENGNQF